MFTMNIEIAIKRLELKEHNATSITNSFVTIFNRRPCREEQELIDNAICMSSGMSQENWEQMLKNCSEESAVAILAEMEKIVAENREAVIQAAKSLADSIGLQYSTEDLANLLKFERKVYVYYQKKH